MKRLTVAILALSLVACATDKPKSITEKQASQANVMATPPTPLDKWNSSVEKLFTPDLLGLRYLVSDFGYFTGTISATGNAVATFSLIHNNAPISSPNSAK